ncbi:MAG: beta-propeller domain-containing protein [Phycisphaerae bacterium]|nr:beta-propeller domain-containing protein [Phycisphaerae bacterium]
MKLNTQRLSPSPRAYRFVFGGTSMVAALAAMMIAVGCDTAQSLSPVGNGSVAPNTPGPNSSGDFGAPSQDSGSGARASESVARAIEEADIVKIVDGTLYALNRFKGLLIVDVQDPDSPALLGQLDLRGRGVEMYVGGNQAYVLLSADTYYYYGGGYGFGRGGVDLAVGQNDQALAIAPDGPMPPRPDFEGSRLAIIDVSDPTAPTLESKVNLVGFANESRRVGDVIYVVGSNYAPYFAIGAENSNSEDAPVGEGFVASVNVADPANITPVERKSLSGAALTMHTSDSAIFAASQAYDFNSGNVLTEVQVIDISDPDGSIALRGKFTVPGWIRNRFYMDAFGDVFRIATESTGFGFQAVKLFTYDISDRDDVKPLGSTKIIENESLQAMRFDGERAYAVTFLIVDPLFVIDLSDPAAPVVAGELKVPGYSTHIEPRGDRLIAIGIDDTNGNRPAVAYYDVKDPAAPKELGRVILGPPGSYTSSDATYDEKAFKVVEELGLIVVPFQHVDWGDSIGGAMPPSTGTARNDDVKEDDNNSNDNGDDEPFYYGPSCTNGVQLIDFSDTALTQRGSFESKGNASRVGVLGDRLFALSDIALTTINISDRDKPTKAGEVTFFSGEDMRQYGNCGYIYDYYPGNVVDPGFSWSDFPLSPEQIDRLIAVLETCAAGTPLPGAVLMMTLCIAGGTMRARRRNRRSRR